MAIEYVEHTCTGIGDRCMENWWKRMIKSSIWSTCYEFIVLIYTHIHCEVLRLRLHYKYRTLANKIRTGHFIYYAFVFALMYVVHCLLMLFLNTNKKQLPKTTLGWLKELSKVYGNCSIYDSTPVMSYATHIKAQSLTNRIYIRSRTFTNHLHSHSHTHTRWNCINMCNVWSDLILFSFIFCLFLLLLLRCCCSVVLHRFWDIACMQFYLFLEQLFFSFLMLSFTFFHAIKFSIRFFVVVCFFHSVFLCRSFTKKNTTWKWTAMRYKVFIFVLRWIYLYAYKNSKTNQIRQVNLYRLWRGSLIKSRQKMIYFFIFPDWKV